ncbi:MAG: N,N-dimethylformamidase beta subunit family domain-containing protein [Hyphomicrobiales bacterium]
MNRVTRRHSVFMLSVLALLAIGVASIGYWASFNSVDKSTASEVLAVEAKQPAPEEIATPLPVCPFEKIELDLLRGPENPVISPFNSAIENIQNGTEGRKIDATTVGTDPQFILGYPQDMSVHQGEPIQLHYASGIWGAAKWLSNLTIVDALTNVIVRKTQLDKEVHKLSHQKCAAWYNGGCSFATKLEFATQTLVPGPYYVFLTDDSGHDSHPIFVNIKPIRGEISNIKFLLVYPDLTWAAYNRFGGGSLYSMFALNDDGQLISQEYLNTRTYSASTARPMLVDPGGHRRHWTYQEALFLFRSEPSRRFSVRFDAAKAPISKDVFIPNRPRKDPPPSSKAEFPHWIQRFDESPEASIPIMQFMQAQGREFAAITQSDLNRDPSLISPSHTIVFAGHHEYWTRREFDTILDAVSKGANIANFAGNVFWGQVNLFGKDIYIDQVENLRGVGKACRSIIPEVFHDTGFRGFSHFPGSERLLGVSYRFGGYPIHEYYWLHRQGLKKYGVTDTILEAASGVFIRKPDHPVFRELNFKIGDRWGKEQPLVSLEVDGIPLDKDGHIDRSFSMDIPKRTQVLADGYLFSANRVWDHDVIKDWYGLTKPGIFVETHPFDLEESGKVISFGSISYSLMLALEDKKAEKVFSNTLDFLSK